jgi:hypothetical protein
VIRRIGGDEFAVLAVVWEKRGRVLKKRLQKNIDTYNMENRGHTYFLKYRWCRQ